ncbi:MAG: hypothetical protein AAFO91_00140 [Bacteroidota bacterium]
MSEITIPFKKVKAAQLPPLTREKLKLDFKQMEPIIPHQPFLAVFTGLSGMGKTYATAALLKMMCDYDMLHEMYIITPTLETNRDLFENVPCYDEDNVYEGDDGTGDLIKALADMKARRRYLDRYRFLYDQYMAGTLNESGENELWEFAMDNNGVLWTPPKHKEGFALVIDDMQGMNAYSNNRADNPYTKIAIKFRHLAGGFSLFFLNQSFKNSSASAIRNNSTVRAYWASLGARDVHEHSGKTMPLRVFSQMYHHATSEPHGFLFVDVNNIKMPFRRGFDEFYMIPSLEEMVRNPKVVHFSKLGKQSKRKQLEDDVREELMEDEDTKKKKKKKRR